MKWHAWKEQMQQSPEDWSGDDAVQLTEETTDKLNAALQRRYNDVKKQYDAMQLLKNRMLGVAEGPADIKPPTLKTKKEDSGLVGTTDSENKKILASLQRRLLAEREMLKKEHDEAIKNIEKLTLSREDMEAAGFKSMEALRKEYLDRENKAYTEAEAERAKKADDELKKKTKAIIDANQQTLDSLQSRLDTEEEKLKLSHDNTIQSINNLVLTEIQLHTTGYDSIEQLRKEYLAREDKQFKEAMDKLKEKSGVSVSEATQNFKTLADMTGGSVDDIKSATTGWANDFSTSMANMVTQGKLDFSSLAESIINDLIRIAIQAQITKPLMDSVGMGGSGGGSTKKRATGGPVTRGSTYLVGEKGPELFTASNSGSIIPNNQLGGGGTVVNIYNEAGADVQTNTRQTPQGDVIEIMLKQVEGRMNEQINRGQGLAQTLEGRYSLTRNSF